MPIPDFVFLEIILKMSPANFSVILHVLLCYGQESDNVTASVLV